MPRKILADRSTVPSRMYYYLLDFNDRDAWKTICDETGKTKLRLLTKEEFLSLFNIATAKDLQSCK